jgi:hypothetical protein
VLKWGKKKEKIFGFGNFREKKSCLKMFEEKNFACEFLREKIYILGSFFGKL